MSPKIYPKKIRRVKYYDADQNRTFVFLTNDFESSAKIIADLYHKRCAIELFFKWTKQHLKIKSFRGTSENSVKIQIFSAIIAKAVEDILSLSGEEYIAMCNRAKETAKEYDYKHLTDKLINVINNIG